MAVRKQIAGYRNTLPEQRGRRLADADLHLTLVFLGKVGADQRAMLTMRAASLDVRPFTLMLDRCGWWPHNGVLWLAPAMIPEALRGLQKELTVYSGECGLEIDARDYSPHLSLYRDVKRAPEILPLPAIRWPVKDFTLVRSDTRPDGAHYTVLQRWRLGN